MTKRNKIIVSIVGISIVLLALLGLTYAYYLTRIEGNTNTNSISITTADLKLVYGDGNGLVTKENIMPGTTIEKTFTVTNSGNNRVNNYAVYLEEVINTLSRTEDLIYELTCESTNGSCAGVSGKFPQLATAIIVNSIDSGVTHTYTLKVTYINEENIDQSIDMGSEIGAFVQIYALKDILDIEGTVANASDGDYVQINSVQKRSQIVDNKYKFAGVLPGTHTIKICGKSDINCDNPKLTKQIEINVGTLSKVNGNAITMTEDSQVVNIDLNASSGESTISTTVKDYNPYDVGTLAFNIYKNSKDNINGTTLVDTPPTKVAEKVSKTTVTDKVDITKLNPYTYWWNVYFDKDRNYYYDEVFECTDDIIGKFIYDEYNGTMTEAILVEGCDGINPLVTKKIEEYEQVLSYSDDDLGRSYYYRGNVTDNYLNFAGMCWRIVRIEGDGSIKLILEDQDSDCEDSNGNWSIGKGNFGYSTSQYSYPNYLRDYLYGEENKDKSMATAFKNYQITLAKKINNNITESSEISEVYKVLDKKIKSGNWCYGNTVYSSSSLDLKNATPLTNQEMKLYLMNGDPFYSSAHIRLNGNKNTYGLNPTLKCDGTILEHFDDGENPTRMYVGTLTVDEVVYAGASSFGENKNFYLMNDYQISTKSNWLTLTHGSMGYGDSIYTIFGDYTFSGLAYIGSSDSLYDINNNSFRPSVSLLPGTLLSAGNGTKNNPYIIE